MPVYAYMYQKRVIESPFDLLLMIPFILANAAGFIYNTICDADSDSPKKNPISAGLSTKKEIYKIFYLVLVSAVFSFLLFYDSYVAFLFFILYIILWLGYSGLRMRFKEKLVGPVVASIVLWAGGPFILIVEYNFLNSVTILLIAAFTLFYTANELNHQIRDYKEDLETETKTFTVRVGIIPSMVFRYILFILGNVLFILSASKALNLTLQTSIIYYLITLFVFFLFDLASYPTQAFSLFKKIFNLGENKYSYENVEMRLYPYSSFSVIKIFILIYISRIMDLSIWLTIILLWAFLTNKRT
ncbi:MAG: UbiA family prenyltransferase [Candidatus Methanoperedens sp.]|nr:UbiA family prenyltransferase [Candidatus Methanoperedens sp.]MCZ7405178.1 UbiA family prenyltransferase [Candidatus Methanoperedens sp.]